MSQHENNFYMDEPIGVNTEIAKIKEQRLEIEALNTEIKSLRKSNSHSALRVQIQKLSAENEEFNQILGSTLDYLGYPLQKRIKFDIDELKKHLTKHNLEQQSKGVMDAVLKLERPDVPLATSLILNNDLLDYADNLIKQSKEID